MSASGGTIRKIVLSAFCVLNIGTVLFINLPAPVTEADVAWIRAATATGASK